MMTNVAPDALRFEAHRPLLLGVAYRMLGSITEAEDVVQDSYLRFSAIPAAEVVDDRSFLVTIVTRLCLDVLKSARKRREQYVGPWLPEPVCTARNLHQPSPEASVDLRESISLAFLLLLERLSPLERAAFLLHDVFDYDYAEVAAVLGRSAPATRQLVSRARQHLADPRARFTAREEQRQQLTERFLSAVTAGDTAGLMSLLADDVAATSDGGGKTASARRVVRGPDRVARFVVGVVRKEPPDAVIRTEINGAPGVIGLRHGRPYVTLVLNVSEGHVQDVFLVRNPDKLRHLSTPVMLA